MPRIPCLTTSLIMTTVSANQSDPGSYMSFAEVIISGGRVDYQHLRGHCHDGVAMLPAAESPTIFPLMTICPFSKLTEVPEVTKHHQNITPGGKKGAPVPMVTEAYVRNSISKPPCWSVQRSPSGWWIQRLLLYSKVARIIRTFPWPCSYKRNGSILPARKQCAEL